MVLPPHAINARCNIHAVIGSNPVRTHNPRKRYFPTAYTISATQMADSEYSATTRAVRG